MKRGHAGFIAYIAIAAVLVLAPSLGLVFGGAETSSDTDSAAPAPALANEDGTPNVNVLADAGAWFDDHFAFRNEYVTAAAGVAGLFGVSASESVIVGADGWLYYDDSVEDYQGIHQLTDRQLFDIAHSMKLVQTYAQAHDMGFVFTIAPNKNTLYGEHMPYYLQVRAGKSNLDRIEPLLEAEGVNYVDARELLANGSKTPGVFDLEPLYHARDSHWNNAGAALVSDALLSALDQPHRDYSAEPYTVRCDFEGDLDKMLFPSAPTLENELYYDDPPAFTYVTEGVESNFDPKIETASAEPDASGSLVMYRDSFTNSLLPFMAEAFERAYFSRGIPYQMSRDLADHEANAIVVERAQRFMRNMAANAPLVPSPFVQEKALPADAAFVQITPEEALRGDYLSVTGNLLEGELAYDARIAVRVNGSHVYEAFGMSDEETAQEGFQLLIPRSALREEGNTYELAMW